MRYLLYLRYVIRHKAFVFAECFAYGLWWQGLVHDWSKFLPSEFLPYANFFYGPKREKESAAWLELRHAFNVAWLKHQHRNPHHYQHWILKEDSGAQIVLEMPARYAKEMVADWKGAGRAITGKSGGTTDWYLKNKHNIVLHAKTRRFVELELGCYNEIPKAKTLY